MQTIRRRLISSAVVLTAGFLSALPFYRTEPELTPSSESPRIERPDSEPPANRSLQVPASDLSPAVITNESAQFVSATEVTKTTPSSVQTKKRPTAVMPQLPNKHPRAQETVPPAAPIRRVAEDTRRVSTTTPGGLAEEKPVTQRMHWIKDGDTLEEIAHRFLGDRARWDEILQCNRDVLMDKDILPIGKQIRIPPSEPSSTGGSLVPIRWRESL